MERERGERKREKGENECKRMVRGLVSLNEFEPVCAGTCFDTYVG